MSHMGPEKGLPGCALVAYDVRGGPVTMVILSLR